MISNASGGRAGSALEPIAEIDVLWITAGLGCDGDIIAMTAATQPSLEEIVGGIPWIPKVRFHNPVLAMENGDEFVKRFRPAHHDLRMDRPAGAEGLGRNRRRHLRHLRRNPRDGRYPTGCMGLTDYLGWDWKTPAGNPIVCVPGCPLQPDNFMETLLYLLHQAAGRAPAIPLDDRLRPMWLFEQTVHEGCDRLVDRFHARHRLGAFEPCGVRQVPQESRAGRQTFVNQFPRFRIVLLCERAAKIQPVNILREAPCLKLMVQHCLPDVVQRNRIQINRP